MEENINDIDNHKLDKTKTSKEPDLNKTDAKVSKQPELDKTDAEVSKQPDLDKTDAKVSKKPELNKTDAKVSKQPELNETDAKVSKQPYLDKTDAKVLKQPDLDTTDAKVSKQPELDKTNAKVSKQPENDDIYAEKTRNPKPGDGEDKDNVRINKPDRNKYPMETTPRGLAMIINNGDFQPESGFNPRHGSNVDVRNLADLFQYLGFRVFLKLDLEKNKIMKNIDDFKKQFEEMPVDMCIFCIMSHGSNGNLVDIEGVEIDVEEEIMKTFYESKALQGKPKLFLFQYCRGGEMDYGVETDSKKGNRKQKSNDQLMMAPKLPLVADILIANSTIPGFVSNRNIRHGTWFFQCFIEVFRENGKHMDIRDMFDKVSIMLTDKESNDAGRRKQTFEMISRGFFKKLYFNPVDNVEDVDDVDEDEDTENEAIDNNQRSKDGLRKKMKIVRKSVSEWFSS